MPTSDRIRLAARRVVTGGSLTAALFEYFHELEQALKQEIDFSDAVGKAKILSRADSSGFVIAHTVTPGGASEPAKQLLVYQVALSTRIVGMLEVEYKADRTSLGKETLSGHRDTDDLAKEILEEGLVRYTNHFGWEIY